MLKEVLDRFCVQRQSNVVSGLCAKILNPLMFPSFLSDLTVTSDGPSWRLTTALRLLALPQTL